MELRTSFQREKEKRENAIYRDFIELSSLPNAALTEVTSIVMRKYNIHSPATVWNIRKRVERRMRGAKV